MRTQNEITAEHLALFNTMKRHLDSQAGINTSMTAVNTRVDSVLVAMKEERVAAHQIATLADKAAERVLREKELAFEIRVFEDKAGL